jgi:tryptophan synthase alpha chain
LLVVDLPPEECAPLWEPVRDQGLDWIPLIAPTSTDARLRAARVVATSVVYYVSMTGVTGATAPDLALAAARALEVRTIVGLPVAVGFGVKTRADVAKIARTGVDAVVVGSAIVSTIERESTAAAGAMRELVADLARGLSAR